MYLCGEGHHGLRGRIAAWKHYHQVETVGQIGITKGAVDLDSPEGLERVIESIRETGLTPSIIAVDTLNRFMLGDENNARDTRVFLDACAVLKQEFGCTVLIVHHTGVSLEAQHRSRGSSAWKGALDIEIRIVPGGGNRSIKIMQTKNKDGELASPMFVDLHQVQIPGWFDEDGEQVTSAVVVEGVEPPQRRQDKKHQERIQSLSDAWQEGGCEEEGGHPYITKSGWMDSIKKRNPEIKESTLKQRFKASDDRYLVGKLIRDEIIEEHRAGYLVIDSQTAAALMLSIENENWD